MPKNRIHPGAPIIHKPVSKRIWDKRIERAKNRYEGFQAWLDAPIDENNGGLDEGTSFFLRESVVGPDMAFYLSRHLDELNEIRTTYGLHQLAALKDLEKKVKVLAKLVDKHNKESGRA